MEVKLEGDQVYGKTDQITDLWSFLQTIDWTEGWLLLLVAFHVLLTALTLLTRNHYMTQAALFFSMLMAVQGSQKINEYAALHWRSFSRQQYFDSQGLFISVVFSMPILFNCLMMVINWLWQSSNMMMTWKREELKARIKRSEKKERKLSAETDEARSKKKN